ncbi:hypothetical protein [Rhodococcus triatomae]|nr:hypothetical protein G419_16975 [Rhodococcus triatomae BKS 15-14]
MSTQIEQVRATAELWSWAEVQADDRHVVFRNQAGDGDVALTVQWGRSTGQVLSAWLVREGRITTVVGAAASGKVAEVQYALQTHTGVHV